MYVANINCSKSQPCGTLRNIYSFIHFASSRHTCVQYTRSCNARNLQVWPCSHMTAILRRELVLIRLRYSDHVTVVLIKTLYVTTTLPACKLWSFTFTLYLIVVVSSLFLGFQHSFANPSSLSSTQSCVETRPTQSKVTVLVVQQEGGEELVVKICSS